MRHVIIGGSIAGISAAKAIRQSDPSADVTVLSGEKAGPYYRPMIPFLIRKGDIDISFDGDLEKRYGVAVTFERAAAIDVVKKQVQLVSGRNVPYDRLLIATGSRPVVPPVPGIHGPGVYTLRTVEDARIIARTAGSAKSAVILGGGLVGIKTAIALRKAGLDVTIVEKLDRILPGKFDRRGAEIIADILTREGIRLLAGTSVSEVVRAEGELRGVKLSSGGTLDAGMLIVAVGTLPDLDVVRDTGIRTKTGIVIDDNLRTSVADIYAAGDVVEYIDLVYNRPAVSALWTSAEEMGKLAGRNMAGGKAKYEGFLSVLNSTEIFDVPVMAIGLVDPDPLDRRYESLVEDNVDSYKKLVFMGSVLAGAVFINDIENAGIYTNLIRSRMAIGGLKEEAIKGSLRYINFIRTVPERTMSA
jgi:nitrite reductase (NADH) large subunit